MRAVNIPDNLRKSTYSPAVFTDGGNTVLVFPVAPQSVQYSRQAEYVPVTPLGKSTTYHQRVRVPQTGLTLSDILVTDGCKDIRPIRAAIDGFVARGTKLSFTQASRTIENLIVSSYDWVESDWLYGIPVEARLSLNCLVQTELEAPIIGEVGEELTKAEVARAKREAEAAGYDDVTVDKGTGSVFSDGTLVGIVHKGRFAPLATP